MGRGNVVSALGYQQADPAPQGDRKFSNVSIDPLSGAAGGSLDAVPGVFSLPVIGNQQIDANGNLVPVFSLFNFAPQNLFQTPFERYTTFSGRHATKSRLTLKPIHRASFRGRKSKPISRLRLFLGSR